MFRRYLGPVKGPKHAPSRASSIVAFAFVAFWCALQAAAHEGHDHEPAVLPATTHALPRLAVSSETYELVAIVDRERMTIYLDRFEDDSPITDAKIAVTIDEEQVNATASDAGTYTLSSGRLGGRGLRELVFDIRAKAGDDLLIGKLMLGDVANAGVPGLVPWYARLWSLLRQGVEGHLPWIALTLLATLAVGQALRRRRYRELLVVFLALQALDIATTHHVAQAHDGDHADASTAAPTGDTARRLPDGRVFVPKPMQRILDIHTVVAKSDTYAKAASFIGRVITDPNRSGVVQSIGGGRIVATERGLPRLGQTVAKGDLLAMVEPPMPLADRTTISERSGELEQMIAVTAAKLRRLRGMAERGVAPQALVVEAEAELDGLYRRRTAVRETRVAPEELRAPIDGVIAAARVVAGQVVQAQDLLFQIVDPNSLWVEAYDYGDNDPATLGPATAPGPGGTPLRLVFRGWGRMLQQQATVLQFAVTEPPSTLRVGQPLTVTAQRNETARGTIVERDAVVRGGNGEVLVWCHTEPELFEARAIRIEPFDATRALIVAGLRDGERIVVRGAELINQIR
jgi:hypothetical protein